MTDWSGSPIVFVDVDGVLVTGRPVQMPRPIGFRANGTSYRRPPRHAGYHRTFVPAAIDALNAITATTGALLVMSSFWRLRPEALTLMREAGINGPWHTDWCTDDLGGGRGAQICRWLETHGDPPFVILDDRAEELQPHLERLVRPAWRRGLNAEHVAEAIAILDRQAQPTGI